MTLLYVSDILMAGSSMIKIGKLKDIFNDEFEMKGIGEVKRIMGMDIMRIHKKSEYF